MNKGNPTDILDFRTLLSDLFEDCFVIADFEYKGIRLDYSVITTDRLIEIRHITSKQEYATEMSVVARSGKIKFDKHKSIQSGGFISNAFYFLCPPRILTASEIPSTYGLITYNDVGVDFKKTADWHDPTGYLSKSTYATMAKKLCQKLYATKK